MDFIRLKKLLGPALYAVTFVFSAFGSALTKLAPPVPQIDVFCGIANLFSAVLLLVIAWYFRTTNDTQSNRAWSTLVVGLFVMAFVVFFTYQNQQAKYVYYYPPTEVASPQVKRYIRGEIHNDGKLLLGTKTVDLTVYEAGGPDYVNNQQLLWLQTSRDAIVLRLQMLYLAFVFFITAALYAAAIRLIEPQAVSKARRTGKRKSPIRCSKLPNSNDNPH